MSLLKVVTYMYVYIQLQCHAKLYFDMCFPNRMESLVSEPPSTTSNPPAHTPAHAPATVGQTPPVACTPVTVAHVTRAPNMTSLPEIPALPAVYTTASHAPDNK